MKKKQQQQTESPFWSPDRIGETHSGTFGGWQKTDKGAAIHVGNKLVGISYGLRSALLTFGADKLKVGKTKIALTFEGQKKSKKGRRVNQLVIEINGKEIPTSAFHDEEPDALKDFLADDENFKGGKK